MKIYKQLKSANHYDKMKAVKLSVHVSIPYQASQVSPYHIKPTKHRISPHNTSATPYQPYTPQLICRAFLGILLLSAH